MHKTKLTTLSAILMSSMLFAAGSAIAQSPQQEHENPQEAHETDAVDNAHATNGAHSTAAAYISSAPANAVHADDLIGANVKSTQADDEDIGSISNILIDRDGEAVGVIIGVGGFLGVGEKDVAVEWDSLDITEEDNGDYVVRIDATQEALEGADEYVTN